MFVCLLVMSAKNRAKAFDEGIVYALPLVGKASINIKQQQRESYKCAYNVFIQLATNWLWQVALLRGLALCHRLQTWDRSQHMVHVLVISPLVSLMIDKVRSLYARIVPAAILRATFLDILVFLYTPMMDTSDIFSRIMHTCTIAEIISACANNV